MVVTVATAVRRKHSTARARAPIRTTMAWGFGRMLGLAGCISKESTGTLVACQQPTAEPSSVPSSSPHRVSVQSPPTDEVAARAEERRTSGPTPGAGGANLHSSSEASGDGDHSSLDGSSIQEGDAGLEGAGGPSASNCDLHSRPSPPASDQSLAPWEVEEGFRSKDEAVKYIEDWAVTKGFQAKIRTSKVRLVKLIPIMCPRAQVCMLTLSVR